MPDSSVERIILDLFRREKKSLTISEVSRLTGYDRRTVARRLEYLHHTRNLGMIQHGIKKKYYIVDTTGPITPLPGSHIIIIINHDYSIRWMNEPLCTILGCEPGKIEHITLRHLERVFQAIPFHSLLSHLMSGQTRFIEETITNAETTRNYIFSLSAISEDESQFFIVTGRDITEQQEIKSAYIKKEQSYENLIKNIPGIVFRRDITTNTIELFSDPVYLISKGIPVKTRSSSISLFESYIHHDDQETLVQTLQYALFNQEEYEVEYRVLNRHGYEFHFLERGRPAVDPVTDTQYIDAILTDITSLRKTTELLAESEERFRRLADVISVGIYVTDTNGTLEFVNREWCRQHNLTWDQAIGMNWIEGIHHDDRKIVLPSRKGIPEEDIKKNIFRTRADNDQYTWIRGTSVSIKDQEGTIIGYIGCDTDISEWCQGQISQSLVSDETGHLPENHIELKRLTYELQVHKIHLELINQELARTRDELEESLAQYITLYDTAPVGYLSVDAHSFIKRINHAGAKILGKERSIVRGTPLYSYISEESAWTFWQFFANVHSGGETSCTLHLLRPDQRPCIVHASASADTPEKMVHLILVDVTEKEEFQARLQANEKALSRSQEIAHVGSWYVDLQTGILTWSDEIYRIFGVDRNTFTPSVDTVSSLIHPDDLSMVQNAYTLQPCGSTTTEIDHRIIRQNTREIRHVHEWYVQEYDQVGRVVRLFGVVQDITGETLSTERKTLHTARLSALLDLKNLAGESRQQIMDFARQACLTITKSEYSLIGLMNEEETVLTIHTWSDNVLTQCRMTDKPVLFPTTSTNIWGEMVKSRSPVLINEYQHEDHHSHGLPQGHLQISRFLGVPIIKNDAVVAIFAVANKPDPYQDDDLQALTLLGNETLDILSQKADKEALYLNRYAIESSLNGIVIMDLEGRVTDVNPAFLDILGFSDRDEVLGLIITDLWYDRHEGEEVAHQIIEHGRWIGEITASHSHGDPITLYLTAQTIRDHTGMPVAFMGSVIDVTMRKKADKQLKQQEEFQQLLIHLATGVINIPLDRLNQALQEMMASIGEYTKVDRVYIFQHDWEREVTANTHEWCAPGIKPEIENLQAVPFEIALWILDTLQRGEAVYIPDVSGIDGADPIRQVLDDQGIVSLVLLPLIQDQVCIGFVGFDAVKAPRIFSKNEIALLKVFAEIIANVLSRQQTESVLRESKLLLARTQEIAHVGSWVQYEPDTPRIWTDGACQIFGLVPGGDDAHAGVEPLIVPDDLPCIEAASARSMHRGIDQYDIEYRIVHAITREIRHIYERCVHERDASGTIVRSMGIVQDITRQKIAEQALSQSNQKLRILTTLTRSDLLNMIGEMQQYLDQAAQIQNHHDTLRYLYMAKNMGDRIKETIDFTRGYELFGASIPQWRNIAGMITSAMREIPPMTIEIEVQVAQSLELYGDPLTTRVFSILIENSVAHAVTASRIRFFVEQRDGCLVLVCADNGIGISDEQKEEIFRNGFGVKAGHGLFLAREMLGITGLSIRECGVCGEGARFEILIPPGGWRESADGSDVPEGRDDREQNP